MRYVFVSDIHGQFDKLTKALNEAHFNKDADTIVVLGDSFDRGPKSLEVLQFIMSCPNRILVWGNHDLRLRDLVSGKAHAQSYDLSNGVAETIRSFCGDHIYGRLALALNIFVSDDAYKDTLKLLWQYFDECVYAVEWSNLIGVHGWIPTAVDYQKTKYDKWGYPMSETVLKYFPDWRSSDRDTWYEATWCHTQKIFDQKIFEPNKTLIVGHWHAWRLRSFASNGEVVYSDIKNIDYRTFVYEDKLIAIDGCTNLEPGVVNTYVYETCEVPCLIMPMK